MNGMPLFQQCRQGRSLKKVAAAKPTAKTNPRENTPTIISVFRGDFLKVAHVLTNSRRMSDDSGSSIWTEAKNMKPSEKERSPSI
jgi:hypothetical protein